VTELAGAAVNDLPDDVVEAVAQALATTLVAEFRRRAALAGLGHPDKYPPPSRAHNLPTNPTWSKTG
jgi:hypothetical protein